jgi:hypothetical protein
MKVPKESIASRVEALGWNKYRFAQDFEYSCNNNFQSLKRQWWSVGPVEAGCADRKRGMTKELGQACARDIYSLRLRYRESGWNQKANQKA